MKYKLHERKLSEARQRVREMDLLTGADRGIRTIVMALETGLKCDESAAYDALYMLMDVQASITIHKSLDNVNLKDVLMALDVAKPVAEQS
jgi:hypothetical protein